MISVDAADFFWRSNLPGGCVLCASNLVFGLILFP